MPAEHNVRTRQHPGGIVYKPLPDVLSKVLRAIIHEKVSIRSTAYPDTLVSYQGLRARDAYLQTLRHRDGEWVRGGAFINGIEGIRPKRRHACNMSIQYECARSGAILVHVT